MNKYIKIKLPTGREIYINQDNITVICEDPMNPEKTEIFMSDGIRYGLTIKLSEVLKLAGASV